MIVYVDSFNLYYGALKRRTGVKWLDLQTLFVKTLYVAYDVRKIRYFTAKMTANHKPSRMANQEIYLRALGTTPLVEVHLGRFLTTYPRMPLKDQSLSPRTVEVIKTEEKGSDVNLATYLMVDAFTNAFDLAVVVSNDSDLLLPIQLLRSQFGKKVGVLNPHPSHAHELQANADWMRPLRQGPLQGSQFPSVLVDPSGTFHKPAQW